MVAIAETPRQDEVLEKLAHLEDTLTSSLRRVEQQLATGSQTFQFFQDGLEAFKNRQLRGGTQLNFQAKWLSRIQADTELRFPHRKILEALLRHYDYAKGHFTEVHFSSLVKEARVGKNMAQAYLAVLIQKGYVEERDDGYRKYYKLCEANDKYPTDKSQTF